MKKRIVIELDTDATDGFLESVALGFAKSLGTHVKVVVEDDTPAPTSTAFFEYDAPKTPADVPAYPTGGACTSDDAED